MKDRESAEGIMKQSYSGKDGKSSDKFATVETRGERNSNNEKANECSPTIEERFPERRREEEGKTFANEGYARSKFASINKTGRHRRGEKTSSNSDSEEFELESRDILYRLEKQSHLARKEDTRDIRKPSSYSNGDEQTWRSLARDYEFEEGHGTLETQSYAPIPLSKERENNRERPQSRGKNNDEQIAPNKESAGSEQEDKRALLQGEGRFIRRVCQNVKLVVDSAVGVLIDAEAALRRVTGTGSHVITIVVIIIVIIIIDTIIKETRDNRKETLS